MVQVHTHESVAAVEASQEYGHVGLCATVGLYVCPASTVELFCTLNGNGFGLVYNLATAIVTLSWITFSVFVGQHGTHGFHNLFAHKVL